ncbi:MAG: exosortase F system-associated membrane protein [Flavobacteriales bacterium AspAUS03]
MHLLYHFFEKIFLYFSSIFYLLILIVLIPIYLYFIQTNFTMSFTSGFYVRRFLIQFIFLFIFILDFLYQTYQEKKR